MPQHTGRLCGRKTEDSTYYRPFDSFLVCSCEEQNSTCLQIELAAACGVDAWKRAVNLLHSVVFTNVPIRNSFSDRLFSKKRKTKEETETKPHQFLLKGRAALMQITVKSSDSGSHLVTESQGDGRMPGGPEWRLAVVEA